MEQITLRIVLEGPPAGVAFAIQEGKGSNWTPILKQVSHGDDLVFEFSIGLREEGLSNPDFSGPVVQGKRGERFVYIGIGTFAGDAASTWTRRIKVPLTGIDSRMLRSGMLEARIPGTGRDGTPCCGSVRDFDGWRSIRK